jgi:hypothetical protein
MLMSIFKPRTIRIFAAVALVSGAAFAIAARAADAPPGPDSQRGAMHQHWQEELQAHLDRLAARLEIKASQQNAWQAYSASVRDLFDGAAANRLPPDADAATRARAAADRAGARAQKLARLSDATAKLEQTLDPQQRQVLDEVARRFAHRHGGHDGRYDRHHDGCDAGHDMHGPMHDHMEEH